ncbi:LPD29 domain-containing protein [uncultured Cellulomonas sp.]|uniref:LPD29 domain-containing protein n=1 Tax=uncultured Cellulomonas sp. TaxID=189682 RepID=UPI0026171432|nr:LPD29 domain-containing protein [uncultured Cellulomonas sp.]
MTTPGPTALEPAQVPAAIKRDLRAAFPGVRFSVSRSRGTGWAYINAAWTDGPTEAAVRQSVSAWAGSQWCQAVLTHRSYSPQAHAWAQAEVAAHPGRFQDDSDPYARDNAPHRLLATTDLRDTALPST